MKNLLEKLAGHPLVRELEAQEQAEILQRRQAAGAELARLERDGERAILAAQKELKAVEQKLKPLEEKAQELRAQAAEKKRELAGTKHHFLAQREGQEAILLETADPAIDEAIQFFDEKFTELRRPGVITRDGWAGGTDPVTLNQQIFSRTNASAVKNALDYCRSAIKHLEEMKLRPEFDPAEAEAIKAAIPRIDDFSEAAGKRPMRGKKDVNPRHLLKVDAEIDSEIAELDKKFKKIMRRKR